MKNAKIKKLTITAVLLCLGYVLPFLTLHIPEIGNMLLPMHLPIFFIGFLCGPFWGGLGGAILPIFRSLTMGMPTLFPNAIGMSFELLTYGITSGLIYKYSKKKNTGSVYLSLIISMILGRLVWGLTQMVLLGIGENGFTLALFLSKGFFNAIPGIILQLILIPLVMGGLNKINALSFINKPDDVTKKTTKTNI